MSNDPKEDIERFADIGNYLESIGRGPIEVWPIMQHDLDQRTILYLEFLAGAFMKETGLKASETELVCVFSMDTVKWYFQKRAK